MCEARAGYAFVKDTKCMNWIQPKRVRQEAQQTLERLFECAHSTTKSPCLPTSKVKEAPRSFGARGRLTELVSMSETSDLIAYPKWLEIPFVLDFFTLSACQAKCAMLRKTVTHLGLSRISWKSIKMSAEEMFHSVNCHPI